MVHILGLECTMTAEQYYFRENKETLFQFLSSFSPEMVTTVHETPKLSAYFLSFILMNHNPEAGNK